MPFQFNDLLRRQAHDVYRTTSRFELNTGYRAGKMYHIYACIIREFVNYSAPS